MNSKVIKIFVIILVLMILCLFVIGALVLSPQMLAQLNDVLISLLLSIADFTKI